MSTWRSFLARSSEPPDRPARPSSPDGRRRDPRRELGAAGEEAAAAWYRQAGYEVVDRNWRVREGEIDLVARRGRVLVFCEVKTRRSTAFGAPVEAVTWRKQQRLRALAGAWLAAHPHVRGELRFDVASVMAGRDGHVVEVLEAAF